MMSSGGYSSLGPIAAALALFLSITTAAASEFGFDAPYMGRGSPPNWLQPIACDHAALGKSRNDFKAFATCQAAHYGLPPALAHAVIEIESRFNADAKGADGEVGLMQLMPATARMLGYRGSLQDLGDPATNIMLGVRYLAGARKLARGDLCSTLMKYRAGHNETRFSVLSVRYCERARAILAREGLEVSGPLPIPTFGFGTNGGIAATQGGGGTKVCVRRVLVPGPRYLKCAEHRNSATANRIQALRAKLFAPG